ncbi:hypothetical protein [Undibacterium sp.]|uniref:hypothetical protein n=1 Tax=Undibacterium sp. TaxID=1914977 RepID=UPI0025E64ECC|nr:hypothetical protein [Undibacterium sp.]
MLEIADFGIKSVEEHLVKLGEKNHYLTYKGEKTSIFVYGHEISFQFKYKNEFLLATVNDSIEGVDYWVMLISADLKVLDVCTPFTDDTFLKIKTIFKNGIEYENFHSSEAWAILIDDKPRWRWSMSDFKYRQLTGFLFAPRWLSLVKIAT